jgi:hypothetical protein
MNGYAGPFPLRNRKRGISMSKEFVWNLKKECVGLVVGLAALIGKQGFSL